MPRETRRREGNEIEFSRIVAFSDGVFAIAITLLVLSFNVPEHLGDESLGSALWEQRHNLLAYGISFAVIGRYWVVHHRFFGDLAAVALVGLAMAVDARRAGLADTTPEKAREFSTRSVFIAAVFLTSIPLAFVAPAFAPLLWVTLFFDPAGRLARR